MLEWGNGVWGMIKYFATFVRSTWIFTACVVCVLWIFIAWLVFTEELGVVPLPAYSYVIVLRIPSVGVSTLGYIYNKQSAAKLFPRARRYQTLTVKRPMGLNACSKVIADDVTLASSDAVTGDLMNKWWMLVDLFFYFLLTFIMHAHLLSLGLWNLECAKRNRMLWLMSTVATVGPCTIPS